MLLRTCSAIYDGYLSLENAFSKAAYRVATQTCPDRSVAELYECTVSAQQISQRVLKLTDQPNLQLGFLADFFEVRDGGFYRYSDLMRFWQAANAAFPPDAPERFEHAEVFRILRAADCFSKNFAKLPDLTQAFTNAGLWANRGAILRRIEYKAAEFAAQFVQ